MTEFQTLYELLSLVCLVLLNCIEVYKYYIKNKVKQQSPNQLQMPSPLTPLTPGTQVNSLPTSPLGMNIPSSMTPYSGYASK